MGRGTATGMIMAGVGVIMVDKYIRILIIAIAIGMSGCFWAGLGTGAAVGVVGTHEYDVHHCSQGNWNVHCKK